MSGILDLINKFNKLKNSAYRHAYLKEHIRIGIASQIRILRTKANLSQSQLAEKIGTKQSVISRLEDPDSGAVNLNTLLKIAGAFDVGLLVKFASFGKFIEESQDISPSALAVSNYAEEFESIQTQADFVFSDITCEQTANMSPISVDNLIVTKWTQFSRQDNQPSVYLASQDKFERILRSMTPPKITSEIVIDNDQGWWIENEIKTITQRPVFTDQ